MVGRVRPIPALLVSATALVLAATVAVACGGNPYGSCVTYYTDGDVYRYNTDKAYCEDTCQQRMNDSPGLISSRYFEGSVANPVEP